MKSKKTKNLADITSIIRSEVAEKTEKIGHDGLETRLRRTMRSTQITQKKTLGRPLAAAFLVLSVIFFLFIGDFFQITAPASESFTQTISNTLRHMPAFSQNLSDTVVTVKSESLKFTGVSNDPDTPGFDECLVAVLKKSYRVRKQIKGDPTPGKRSPLFYIFYNTLKTMEDQNES